MSQINIITNSTKNLYDWETTERNQPTKLPSTKKQHSIPLHNHICEHLTTIAHVCIMGVTIYMIALSVAEKFELFNWHPLLFASGWMLLMTEALLMITKDNIFSNRITYTWRVRLHWLMQVVAVAMSLAGFIVAFIYEDTTTSEHGIKSHFSTSHGFYGLISLILGVVPTLLSGVSALFSFNLRKIISPIANKCIHATCGIASVIFGAVTMVLSLYTGWFTWKTAGDPVIFTLCYIGIVFSIVWSLMRPVITFYERMKGFLVQM